MKPLDIKELQNRLDAISEEQVNELMVKSAKDVFTTLPAFAYRASDPKDEEPEDKMYTAAVGDRADEMFEKLKAWLAAGNEFSPEEMEELNQAASGPELIGLRGDADEQDVIDMLNSGLDTLENIISDKTESVEEDDDFPELRGFDKMLGPDPSPERLAKFAKAEAGVEEKKEEYRKLITFDLVKPAAIELKKELEDTLEQMNAGDEDAFDPDIEGKMMQVDELLDEGPGKDGNFIAGLMGDSESNYIGNDILGNMNSYNKDAATVLFSSQGLRHDFNTLEKMEPVHQAAKNLKAKSSNESVQEGDAELAELKDIMGRSGVMGMKF